MRYLPLLFLLACNPSSETVKNADYGTFPENYREIVQLYIENFFYDPLSIQGLEISEPIKGWQRTFSTVTYGYIITFRCNAKNQYGGYTGRKEHRLLVRDGKIVWQSN